MRKASHSQFDAKVPAPSSCVSETDLPRAKQSPLNFAPHGSGPENLDDDAVIRHTISAVIRACRLSREQIADEMTKLLGTRVTEKMLYSYTGESNQQYRFAAAWVLAFCQSVGDFTLLQELALRAGFRMIGPEEERLIVIGKAYVAKVQAEATLREVQP